MNWEAIGAAGEVVGAIAVVVSLVYLAVQLRVNSKTLKVNGSWNAEMSWASLNAATARDSGYSLLASRAAAPEARLDDFDEAERAQLWFLHLTVFQTTQAEYYMWKDECLSEEVWKYRLSWFRSYILLPVVGVHWEQMKSQNLLSPTYINEIELERGQEHYMPSVKIESVD